jgi:hypothetical protein
MMRITPQMRKILADPAGHGLTHCVLCDAPSLFVGFWFPTLHVERRLHMPSGGMVVYGLCTHCERMADRFARVEAHLFVELSLQ